MTHAKPRRTFLIDHRFQLRLAGEFVVLQVALITLMAAGLFVFMQSEIQANLASAHASYRSFGQMLLPIVSVWSVLNIVISSVLVTIIVVHRTKHLARPIAEMQADLEELAHRRFPARSDIHPDDQLSEAKQFLTSVVNAVKTDIQALQRATLDLRRAHEMGDTLKTINQIEAVEHLLERWGPPPPKAPDSTLDMGLQIK